MNETKRWVAVTEDGNGKIQIFYKFIDESESWAVEAFQREVEGWSVTILAMFREEDVVGICGL